MAPTQARAPAVLRAARSRVSHCALTVVGLVVVGWLIGGAGQATEAASPVDPAMVRAVERAAEPSLDLPVTAGSARPTEGGSRQSAVRSVLARHQPGGLPSEPVPGLLAGLPGGDLAKLGALSGTSPTGQPAQALPVSSGAGVLGGVPTGARPLRQPVPSSALPVTGDLRLPTTGGILEQARQVTELTGALPMASSSAEPSGKPGVPLVPLAGALMAVASMADAGLRRLAFRG